METVLPHRNTMLRFPGWMALVALWDTNIYRGNSSGGPYTKINSALDATAAYTDNSVLAGQTYYYVTTAVDTSGMGERLFKRSAGRNPKPVG